MSKAKRIVVIGAGIGGLTAAGALRQNGFEVEVYERSPELGEVGAGLQIGPNAVKVLNALGLEDRLRRIAAEPDETVSVRWDDASLRYREPLKAIAQAEYGARYLTAHRADLHRLLIELLPESSIHLGRACVGAESTGAGAVARFADGSTVEADLVVGADGIRSAVRESLFGGDKPIFTNQLFWRGTVAMDRLIPRVAGRFKGNFNLADNLGWLSPRTGRVLCYPMGAGRVLNIAAGNLTERWTSESWLTPAARDEVLAAYRDWDETLQIILAEVDAWFCQGVFDRDPLPRWTEGAVTLLGDAAHPMMPTLAQGAVMALEDAFVLGRSLATGDGIPAGLAAYEAQRRPRTARAQLQARAQYRANLTDPPPPRLDRDWILGFDATAVGPSV